MRSKATGERHAKERGALLSAQVRYLGIREKFAELPEADRLAFNELTRSIERLQVALRAFAQNGRNRMELVRLVSMDRPELGQSAAAEFVDGVEAALPRLGRASRSVPQRGAVQKQRGREWVWAAADQWLAVLKAKPSAAERGRFWQALQSLQEDREAFDVRMPTLTRSIVREALTTWDAVQVQRP